MAAPPLYINVYALIPLSVSTGPNLDLNPTNWIWEHSLIFPLEKLNSLQFSQIQRPYAWVQYAIGVVIGAEGILSTSPESQVNVNLDTFPPTESTNLYYHISDEEKQRMFPVDPQINRTQITSSISTARGEQFAKEVARRDGNKCVMSKGNEVMCDAVHLLSHSKGDMYISTFTQHCSRSHNGDDIIHDIDDIRNGLFLMKNAHAMFGKDLAFLRTPNFAMTTTDIDPTAPPTEKRYTTHAFQDPTSLEFYLVSGFSGSQIQSSDIPEYPPAILFDIVYAGAVLHHFGTQTLKDSVSAIWGEFFYPSGTKNVAHADYKVMKDEQATAAEKKYAHDRARSARHNARSKQPDTFDMLMFLPYARVPPSDLHATLKEAKEKAEAAEQKRVQEKVNAWRGQVPAV